MPISVISMYTSGKIDKNLSKISSKGYIYMYIEITDILTPYTILYGSI